MSKIKSAGRLAIVFLIIVAGYLAITFLTSDSTVTSTVSTPEISATLVTTTPLPPPTPQPPANTPEIDAPVQLPTIKPTATPPISSTNAISESIPISYTVVLGDSLSKIATQFDIPVGTIAAANHLADFDAIQAGQRLLIPSSELFSIVETAVFTHKIIGYSANGYPLAEYVFGEGEKHIVFVGGIHGGYEWNTILLAYEMIDYFLANPDAIPETITLHIIPSANPDGQFAVTSINGRFSVSDVADETALGRFNGNDVDLNRNWDCEWQPESTWRNQITSGGGYAFSEPETAVLRELFLEVNPVAVGFWHSQLGEIFAAGCGELFHPAVELAEIYAENSHYPTQTTFTAYTVTGDVSNWLSTVGIPAITIELTTHVDTEFDRNIAGVLAVLDAYR